MNLAFNCLNENPVFVISTEGRNLVNRLICGSIQISFRKAGFRSTRMTGFTSFRSS